MKTADIVAAHDLLEHARISQMADTDKFALITAMHRIKAVATDFKAFAADARERLKDERFTEMQDKLRQWQEEGEKTALTAGERKEISDYFANYARNVEQCVKPAENEQRRPGYKPITAVGFQKLLAGADYDLNQSLLLHSVLCHEEEDGTE